MAVRQTRTLFDKQRAPGLRIDLDDSQMDALLAELRGMPKQMQQAKTAAVNKTLKTAKARLSQKIAGKKGVTTLAAKEAKDRIRVKRQASSNLASGVIAISDRGISLYKYGGLASDVQWPLRQKGVKVKKRKPPKGARWKVYKDDKFTRRKNFFATRSKKRNGPFIMKRPMSGAKGGEHAKPPRDYRIAYGPSIWKVMEVKRIVKPSLAEIRAILKKNLESQVDRFLKRKKNA